VTVPDSDSSPREHGARRAMVKDGARVDAERQAPAAGSGREAGALKPISRRNERIESGGEVGEQRLGAGSAGPETKAVIKHREDSMTARAADRREANAKAEPGRRSSKPENDRCRTAQDLREQGVGDVGGRKVVRRGGVAEQTPARRY